MKKLTENQTGSKTMNRNNQNTKTSKIRQRMPLYASPWVALYTVLRNELMQTRPGSE